MNQFLVPQFIDVEPKILGPMDLRQFITIVIGIVAIVLCYKFADLSLFIVEAIIIASAVILLTFVKINGRGFHFFLLDIVMFFIGSDIRVWRKEERLQFVLEAKENIKEEESNEKVEIRGTKLSELSLLLDTGGAYKAEDFEEEEKEEEARELPEEDNKNK